MPNTVGPVNTLRSTLMVSISLGNSGAFSSTTTGLIASTGGVIIASTLIGVFTTIVGLFSFFFLSGLVLELILRLL